MRLTRRHSLTLMGGCAAASLIAASTAVAQTTPVVNLLPLWVPKRAEISRSQIERIRRAILAFYAVQLRLLPRERMPPAAYYAPRARYRAERILDHLRRHEPPGVQHTVALTAVDISTTKGPHHDWGILGLADLPGVGAVVSSFRTKRAAKDAKHADERLAKVAVHELGHAFGLPHCPTRGCLMEDAGGTVITLDREFDLCVEVCRPRLLRLGYQLGPGPSPFRRSQ